MDLPTYTNIWRIEKRLYKLYDFNLPIPLPMVQIGTFLVVFVTWVLFLRLARVPFQPPWHVVYLVPPGLVTYLATRPVLEGKRLTELLLSQLRYLTEPATWCRLTPVYEPERVTVVGVVWRRRGASDAPGRKRPVGTATDTDTADTAAPVPSARSLAAAAPLDGALVPSPAATFRPAGAGSASAGSVLTPADTAPGPVPGRPPIPAALPAPETSPDPAALPAPKTRPAPPALPAPEAPAPSALPVAGAPDAPAALPAPQRPSVPPPAPATAPAASSTAPAASSARPPSPHPAAPLRAASAPSPPAPPAAEPLPAQPPAPRPVHPQPPPPVAQNARTARPAAGPPAAAQATGDQHAAPGKPMAAASPAAKWPEPVVEGPPPPSPRDRVEGVEGAPPPPAEPPPVARPPSRAPMPPRSPLRRLARLVRGGSGERGYAGSAADEMAATITGTFPGARRVMVVGCGSGVGQTTASLMLGHTLASNRRDRCVALDAAPGPASLARRSRMETPETLGSLLPRVEHVSGYLTLRAYTSQARSGLEIIASDEDVANAARAAEDGCGPLAALLDRYYKVSLYDVAASAAGRVLPLADQLVLVAPASAGADRVLTATLDWLNQQGYAELASTAVLAVNGVRRNRAAVVGDVETAAAGRVRSTVGIPRDGRLDAKGAGPVELETLQPAARNAYVRLAYAVTAGFSSVPDRYRKEVRR